MVLLRGEEVIAFSDPFVRLAGINLSHTLDLEALLACLFVDHEQRRLLLGTLRAQRRGDTPLSPLAARAQLPEGPHTLELTAGTGHSWLLTVRVAEDMLASELRAVLPGCAHDLNNVLTILVFATNELSSLSEDQRQAAARQRIRQLEHGRDLVRALSALSQYSHRLEVLQPGPLLARFREVFGRSITGLSVQLLSTPPVGTVHIDQVLLDRILLNLLINARDAAAPEPVAVAISQEYWPRERVRAETGGALDIPCVCVLVSDDGPGIPESLHERIFTPHFSTRSSQGLGLTTVRQLMRECGGEVLLESTLGHGATFRLLFPSCSAP